MNQCVILFASKTTNMGKWNVCLEAMGVVVYALTLHHLGGRKVSLHSLAIQFKVL